MIEPTNLNYSDWPPGEALGLRRLAHDLMTPITVLMGNLQLFLMRKDLPPPVAAKIEDLYKQAQHLMKMVQDSSQHAYDTVWSGTSGSIAERWEAGKEVASSVLTRAGVAVDIMQPTPTVIWNGEPEAWREWMGSVFASVANRMERGGKIELSATDRGWKLTASHLNLESNNFPEWLASLRAEQSDINLAGYRRYCELLVINSCIPQVNLEGKNLTIEYNLG